MNQGLISMLVEHLHRMARSRYVSVLLVSGTIMLGACPSRPSVPADQGPVAFSHEADERDLAPTNSRVTQVIPEKEATAEISTPVPTEELLGHDRILYSSTNHNPDGNRWVHGQGRLPQVEP